MAWRLPNHTRIILIPADERSSREYTIGRGLILTLATLLLVLAAVVILVLASYARLAYEGRQVARLRQELIAAQGRVSRVDALNQELEQMRSLQERLLVMLGVQAPDVAPGDTLVGLPPAPAEDGPARSTEMSLQQTAALVMTPPPDLWPAAGYVTREFQAGSPARGVLPHHGIDIAAPEEAPVRAAGPGRVTKARWDDFLGNYVEIQHGFGYVTVYGHCSRLAVQEGDRVDRGQVVGYLGGTGRASAPHLHFEVWREGVVVDPRTVLPGGPPH